MPAKLTGKDLELYNKHWRAKAAQRAKVRAKCYEIAEVAKRWFHLSWDDDDEVSEVFADLGERVEELEKEEQELMRIAEGTWVEGKP